MVSLSNDALQRSGTAETSDLGVVASEELVLPPDAQLVAAFVIVPSSFWSIILRIRRCYWHSGLV